MTALLINPVVLLVLLGAASWLAWRFLMGAGESPVPSGAIVMSGGIFVIAALTELPMPALVGKLVVLELLVVWGFLAFSYLRSARRDSLGVRRPVASFAVGTWVAGSAVLRRALGDTLLGWQPVALALWVFAVAVWLWYLGLLPAAFRDAADASDGYRATGAVLLPAVATQSLVVAGDALLPGGVPPVAATVLIGLGLLFYAGGFVPVVRRYGRRGWTLADDWDDTNCIPHGAMSITGLALVLTGVLTGVLPDAWAVAAWTWALAAFVLVEGIEAARAVVRTRTYGLKDGVLSYLPAQWSRNFTFGMFYALTLQLQANSITVPAAGGLQAAIVSYGPYIVLALLVSETIIFLSDRIRTVPRSGLRSGPLRGAGSNGGLTPTGP